jgi:hypothetical protein
MEQPIYSIRATGKRHNSADSHDAGVWTAASLWSETADKVGILLFIRDYSV